jgi:hypothetical protein
VLTFARVLALSSDVLAVFADPVLALTAANGAIRRYTLNIKAVKRSDRADRALHLNGFVRAAEVAGVILAAHGRDESAREARKITDAYADLGVTTVLRQRQGSPRPPALDNTLAAALDAARLAGADGRIVGGLLEALVQTPDSGSHGPFTPLGRVMAGVGRAGVELAPERALTLAGLAHRVLPGSPRAGPSARRGSWPRPVGLRKA